MFRFRFETLIRLRQSERDTARGALAEAAEALDRIDRQRQELQRQRAGVDRISRQMRSGMVIVDNLLSHGRYVTQLAAEDAGLVTARETIQAELNRRQLRLAEAITEVKRLELLREREQRTWMLEQAKKSQASMDELAARRGPIPVFHDANRSGWEN